jgi:hypothetical protein
MITILSYIFVLTVGILIGFFVMKHLVLEEINFQLSMQKIKDKSLLDLHENIYFNRI